MARNNSSKTRWKALSQRAQQRLKRSKLSVKKEDGEGWAEKTLKKLKGEK